MIHSLDHVAVFVNDLEAATRDYARLLGLTPSWQGEHPGRGTANTLFKLENSYLELLSPTGEGLFGDVIRTRIAAKGEGPGLLAFGCDDAEAARDTLRERGLSVSDPQRGLGQDRPSGAWRRFSNVHLPLEQTGDVQIIVIEHESPPEILTPGQPLGNEAGVCHRLDHVVVMTPDPERALDLYGSKLGLRLALDKTFPERGVRLIFFRIGGATVEIGARMPKTEGDLPAAEGDVDDFWGIAWQVPDADVAHARLAEAGFDLSRVRAGNKPGTRVFTVKSRTHGVPTLIIEPVKADDA